MSKEYLWDITKKEQTQIKLNILEQYLRQWATIIGNNFTQGYYIDCFAGRGRYHKDGIKDCVPGSPLLAQKIASEVQAQKSKKGKNFRLKIIAIEADKRNIRSLNKFLKEGDPEGEVDIKTEHGEFQRILPTIIRDIGSNPAFFFIDPYGIKIPKDTLDLVIDRAETQGKTEIFLNYMSMGVKRVAGLTKTVEHHKESIRLRALKGLDRLDMLFGDRSWIDKEGRELLTHFAGQVLRRGFKLILNFDVPYPDRSGTFYNLIFATNNLVAKKIMSHILTRKLFEGTLFERMPFQVDHELQE
ncbi:MAG TPA: three-Cys-motif partner protein TcmP [Thermodesulfovibrionales bacterium]|nr:three-Cys-motif partner protein TcmP [Thermodesulfovibrionales bacterium]